MKGIFTANKNSLKNVRYFAFRTPKKTPFWPKRPFITINWFFSPIDFSISNERCFDREYEFTAKCAVICVSTPQKGLFWPKRPFSSLLFCQ